MYEQEIIILTTRIATLEKAILNLHQHLGRTNTVINEMGESIHALAKLVGDAVAPTAEDEINGI